MAQYIRTKTESRKHGNEFWPTQRRGNSWVAEWFAVSQHAPWSTHFFCYKDTAVREK